MANITKKRDEKAYSELKEAILASKRSFLIVGFFSMFINIMMLTPSLYMLQLYDRVVGSRSEETLIMLTLIVVVIYITMSIFEMVRSRILVKIGNSIDEKLSKRIFGILFDLENRSPGKGSSLPLNDLTQVRQFMTGNGLFAFFDAPWIPIYIFVLFLFHPYFGYFSIFAAVVLVTLAIINEYSTKEKLLEANNLNRAASIYVDANIRNAEVVNAMGMKSNIEHLWLEKHYSFLHAQNEASNKAGVWSNLSKGLRTLFQSLILGVGAYLTIHSEISGGMMIAGSILMGRALAPLDLMIGGWKGFSSARTSYNRLDALLSDFPKDKEYMRLPSPKGEIILENVVVVPPNASAPSVKGVSMMINRGDVVGIIGPSAAGKSSLVRAMLGLWPLASGKARLDGADISQWDRVDLGGYIGYLPQDVELFAGTISQNIARFGEVDPDKVVEAAKKAGVHDMILRLPDGYDTLLGVGGIALSGGQRQRIGFARAIYNNPTLVVLDEPNSNLDDAGEAALAAAITTLRTEGTTVVLITHRPSLLQATNKIAVLKAGLLELYGASGEILAKLTQAQKQVSTKPQPPLGGGAKVSLSKPGE
ncbi:MAG: type I secretion system permease/ATPase [Sulfuricurvum sp.]